MNPLYEQFTAFFDKYDWSYQQQGDKPVLRTHFFGDNGRWEGIALARVENEHIAFFSLFPSRAPAARRAAAAELFTRLNYGLKHGSFQMDMEDGEIRFVTSLIALSGEVSLEAIERLVFVNVGTVDDFYETIMKVLHGGVSAKMAVARKKRLDQQPKPTKTSAHKRRFDLN